VIALVVAAAVCVSPAIAQQRVTGPRPVTSLDLVRLRDVAGVRISPDGEWVAYQVHQAMVERNSYHTEWFVVGTAPGARPVVVSDGGEARFTEAGEWWVELPEWSPDSRWIAFTVMKNGEDQLWRARRDGGAREQLTQSAGDVRTYRWSADGNALYFTADRPRAELAAAEREAAEQGIVVTGAFKPWLGEEGLGLQARQLRDWGSGASAAKDRLRVYGLRTRREREPTPAERDEYGRLSRPVVAGFEFVAAAQTSRAGHGIAVASAGFDSASGRYRYTVYLKRTPDAAPIALTPASPAYIAGVWWNDSTRRIWFSQLIGEGRLALKAVPVDGGPVEELAFRTSDYLGRFSFDAAGRRVACVRENATSPPEVAVADLSSGEVRTLTALNPEFADLAVSTPRRLWIVNEYGDTTWADFLQPLNHAPGRPSPLVVTTYRSSGFLRGAVGDEYPIQVFAANGFAVLSFERPRDYAPGFNARAGQPFDRVLLNWKSPMASLHAALKLLSDSGWIDPHRAGLTGLSNGAEITNFTMTHSDLFQAAVATTASARDPLFYYLADSTWHSIFATWGLGGLPEGVAASRWQELSPALNAERVTAPLLFQPAASEFIFGMQFYTRLKELGRPVEMIIYPGEGHVKHQPKHRLIIYQRNVDWMRFWLQGYEDPDPAKREQYERWRKLRRQPP
jgi:dipeptidyl aminopeptidase/acylaminoacyl peptidase